ncbi:uncharacterized protein SRS1_14514 [Sporisorium reilianum f. sp. reilianum]|uniref:Uncharacterized protein n=1 Tax=Sporisorium reilianum f. sp. reilianum TaxID=72559 RepID=A0A2N8UFM9_9BASI|nr:uncharacterized protein SRS1_14514 [Sporisorium reilianum f. sp. reilianum]
MASAAERDFSKKLACTKDSDARFPDGATFLPLPVRRYPALPQRSRLARQEGGQRHRQRQRQQHHQQRWQQQQGGGAVLFAPYPVEVWQESHSRRDHPFLAEPSAHQKLALSMKIKVFEPGSDKALREIIFDSSNTALRPGSRLEIRKEWRSVPTLLCDRSIFTDDKHRHKTVHKMRLVAMPHSVAASCLSSIAGILGWDGLTFYNYRRTFATLVKHQIPDEQLKLLMGHRRSRSWVADSVYVSDHCQIDRSGFAAGGRWTERLHSVRISLLSRFDCSRLLVGSRLAVAETERQSLCPIRVEQCLAPTDDIEKAIVELRARQAYRSCTDQGLACISAWRRILYHRHRQVRFMAMHKAQLNKVCVHASTSAEWKSEHLALQEMGQCDMVQVLTSFYSSALFTRR